MKHQKKIIFLSFCVITIFTVYYFKSTTSIKDVTNIKRNSDWIAFEKKQIGKETKTIQRKPKPEELPINVKNKKNKSPKVTKKKEVPMYLDREIKAKSKKYKSWDDQKIKSKLVNTPAKDWKEKLVKRLNRFSKDDTKILIKHDASRLLLEKNKARFAELVQVSYVKPNKSASNFFRRKMSSLDKTHYNAYVDSESGRIIRTWGIFADSHQLKNPRRKKIRNKNE